jgi:hypothetical protein
LAKKNCLVTIITLGSKVICQSKSLRALLPHLHESAASSVLLSAQDYASKHDSFPKLNSKIIFSVIEFDIKYTKSTQNLASHL